MCKADKNSRSHAGYHSFKNGSQQHGRFEVFWSDDGINGEEANGWYWQPCFEGCLPDGEAYGPFNSSAKAFLDARGR